MSAATPPAPVTIVTGASSGIGRATARLFAARGHRVVLAARSAPALEQLQGDLLRAGGEVLVAPVDLADPAQGAALVDQTVKAFGRLDVLVNNAGYGSQCRFEEMPPDEVARMFAVNVLSCMAAARAAVPILRRQGGGSIVNVASVGGLVAHPLNVAYCASKHALVGFSRSLRLELKGSGIRVTAVCPGATRTEFFAVARGGIPFAPMIDRFALPPEVVARAIVRASRKNRALVFPSLGAWLLYLADRWLPWLSEAGNIAYRNRVLGDPGRGR